MPGGGGAGAHPLRCASTLGWRRRGPCFAPPALPLVPGVPELCGGAGALLVSDVPALAARSLWRPLRSHSPEQRPRRQAAGEGTRLGDPRHTRVQPRGAPPGPFLSFQKERKPAARESGSLCVSEK